MVETNEEVTRWRATVWYRTEAGLSGVTHDIEELEELHDLVERGPSFYTIDHIEIRHNGSLPEYDNLTVEASMRL
jgi:hypothetical protein